ncbi:MAG: hypothetical protein HY253_00420 [Burkholderiales bacterium]|nr:hypothetical protein [Burkholderiales bacterium]
MEHHHSSKQPDWKSMLLQPRLIGTNMEKSEISFTYRGNIGANRLNSLAGDDDDSIIFLSEPDEAEHSTYKVAPWKILIADDDTNVHDTTVLALSGVEIHGKPLEFLHAFSAKEAKEVAVNHPDTSLILLDVVMETVDAGLKLVNVLRDELSRKDLRIVLRTGQPGYAQENIMGQYAIDGYATKSKLTRTILISMLSEVLESDSGTGSPEGLPN